MKRFGSFALVCFAIAFIASACSGESTPTGNAAISQIVIGGAISMTGSYQELSLAQVQGYRLAVALLNEQGGIVGRPVKLILYDDQSSPSQSAALYNKLINEDKVDLLLGPYSSEITAATIDIFEAAEIPVVAATASDERIWEGQNRQWTVQLLNPAAVYLKGAVEVAAAAGASSIALVYEDNPFPFRAAIGAREAAQDLGLEIVMDVEYPRTGADFSALANMAKEANADVFLGGGFLSNNVALTKAVAEVGYDPMLQSWLLGVDTTEYTNQVGDLAGCVAGNTWWLARLSNQGGFVSNQTFVQEYENFWRQPADTIAATGFAAVELLVEAVEHSIDTTGELDRSRIRDYLFSTEEETIIGSYAVVSSGEDAGVQTALRHMQIQLQPNSSGELVEEVISRLSGRRRNCADLGIAEYRETPGGPGTRPVN